MDCVELFNFLNKPVFFGFCQPATNQEQRKDRTVKLVKDEEERKVLINLQLFRGAENHRSLPDISA